MAMMARMLGRKLFTTSTNLTASVKKLLAIKLMTVAFTLIERMRLITTVAMNLIELMRFVILAMDLTQQMLTVVLQVS
jgi:hypothetical protein